MFTLTSPKSSHNPFRTDPSTPNITGSSNAPPSASNNPPAADMHLSPPSPLPASSSLPLPTTPPERDLPGLPVEAPPPYTPRPSVFAGESTVEQGPARPFQPAPQRPTMTNSNNGGSGLGRVQNSNTGSSSTPSGRSRTGGSFLQQLSSTFNEVIDNLNASVPPPRQSGSQWSSYPGLQQQSQYRPPPGPPSQSYRAPPGAPPPPPRHPLSSSPPPPPPRPTSAPPSDFAREFYAAGTGHGLDSSLPSSQYAPPPGPPPLPQRPMSMVDYGSAPTTTGNTNVPNDGRPTTHPVPGHPLLHEGKLLVYPNGHECDKCHNLGYKHADPLHPCKKCWHKYGKPFSGPLVYAFSPSFSISPSQSSSSRHNHHRRHRRHSNSSSELIDTGNFQRPLPNLAPRTIPAFSLSPPTANFAEGGWTSNHQGGFFTPPNGPPPSTFSGGYGNTRAIGTGRPPPGAVVYTAGDPRIGGQLCWNCDGRGNTSFIFERVTCDVCGGVGRIFS